MATCVDLAKADYPTEVNNQKIKPRQRWSLPGVQRRPAEPPRADLLGARGEPGGSRRELEVGGQGERTVGALRHRRRIGPNSTTRPPPSLSGSRRSAAQWDAYAAPLQRPSAVAPGGPRRKPPRPGFSRKGRFVLKARDLSRERAKAPAIVGQPFTISCSISKTARGPEGWRDRGPGATAFGHALFVQAGQPRFLVRAPPRTTPLRSTAPKLAAGGAHGHRPDRCARALLSLDVDGKSAADPVAGKLLNRMPVDGLEVGRDANKPVGP